MTLSKKSIVKSSKTSPQSKALSEVPAPAPVPSKPIGISSMRRIVSKKLAVGKLVMAKRLG